MNRSERIRRRHPRGNLFVPAGITDNLGRGSKLGAAHATQLGWQKYHSQLLDWTAITFQYQIERMNEMAKGLTHIDDGSLPDDEPIGRDLAIHFLVLRTVELAKLRTLEKVSMAVKGIGDSLINSGCMPMPFVGCAVALQAKRKYGLDLGAPKETLYQYALRNLATNAG